MYLYLDRLFKMPGLQQRYVRTEEKEAVMMARIVLKMLATA